MFVDIRELFDTTLVSLCLMEFMDSVIVIFDIHLPVGLHCG